MPPASPSHSPANETLPRAAQILREEGLTSLWFKTWGEICYRRVYLTASFLTASFDQPPAPPPADIAVRTAWLDPAELEEYVRARPNEDPALVERRLRAGRLCFVGRCDGDIVYAAWVALHQAWIDYLQVGLRLPRDYAYTYSAWTQPAYRGKGLATRLAWEKNQSLAAMGHPIMVAVLLPENRPALLVSERSGYQRIGMLRTVFLGGWRRSFLRLRAGAPRISIAGDLDQEQRV